MNKKLLALFLAMLMLAGCVPQPSLTPTTAAPYTETTLSPSEQYEEEKLIAQKQFLQLEQEIFREEISSDLIHMHFFLKDSSAYGLTTADSLYAPVGLEAQKASTAHIRQLKERLEQFNPADLTAEQKLTYRTFLSYLNTELKGDGLELYNQPLAPTIGTQAQLPILLCEYSFFCKQDVEDYLALLDGMKAYYQEILDYENQIADAGLMVSDATLDHLIESCEGYLLVPGNNFMIDTFVSRLETVEGLTDEEKEDYKKRNEAILETSFVPAYELLIDGLKNLKGRGTNEKGMCGYPDGKQYYEYLLYSATGTSYSSIDELLNAITASIEENLKETSKLLNQKPELINSFDSYAFRQNDPAASMEELKSLTASDFPPLPACNYTFKQIPKALELTLSPAFYVTSPIDAPMENVIYINENERYDKEHQYPVIAHEGYPGHLYQHVYFLNNCDSDLRKLLSFPGYTEGWASYVESLSYELDNGLEPDLGTLLAGNSMASLGLHAYLDIGINYLGWELADVTEYLSQYYDNPEDVAATIYQTMIENPSNYLSYFVGCLEIENMRQTAEKELGSKFSAREFHTFLLDMGPAPFDVIQPYFTAWLQEQKM